MEQKQVKVRAIMTAPRHEITYCRTMIDTALRQLGIPMQVSLGVFYAQHMQNMLEDACKEDLDYVITVDYDSVFSGEQLHKLISTAAQEQFDCLCAMQPRRGKPALLGYKAGHTKATWSGYPIEVDAAHFGLTVIDVRKLASVAKPWFCCQPGADGRWREDHIDADVWFWKQWTAAGHKVWIDPSIRIGHCEEVVTAYDEEMRVKHYYPKVFDKIIGGSTDEHYGDAIDDSTLEGVEAVPEGQTA